MKTRNQNTYHIVCRVGKKGRFPQGSQTSLGLKNILLDQQPLQKHSDGNHAEGDLPAGPSRVKTTKKKGKKKQKTKIKQRGL